MFLGEQSLNIGLFESFQKSLEVSVIIIIILHNPRICVFLSENVINIFNRSNLAFTLQQDLIIIY